MNMIKATGQLSFNFFESPPHIEKPQNDNDRLLNYQYDYLVNNDQKAWACLWRDFTLLCKKAIKKQIREKGFFLDDDTLIFKSDLACECVMRRYVKANNKGECYIVKNFITQAYLASLYVLFGDSENDKVLDEATNLMDEK